MKIKRKSVEGKPPFTEISTIDEIISQTIVRQMLYRFLSSLFLYPDEEMLINLQTNGKEMFTVIAFWQEYAFGENLQQLISQVVDFDLKDRKPCVDEYNRLFLVKPQVSPYETTYLKLPGQSEGMIAANVSGIYGLSGLAVSPEINELPDHIAIELEFMSFLCEKETTALKEGNQNGMAAAQQEQRNFMENHLVRWFPKFAKKALKEANHELLYCKVVETTFAFLRDELEVLEIRPGGIRIC